MLQSVAGSIPASAPFYFFWLASELQACVCVCLCVRHSTPLSRHAALLLPQYACSRIPISFFFPPLIPVSLPLSVYDALSQ